VGAENPKRAGAGTDVAVVVTAVVEEVPNGKSEAEGVAVVVVGAPVNEKRDEVWNRWIG
jgi:hypothetical protein